jgi:phospholipid/cholesterol/gamma-HCH transport system substrate-binding protein
MADSSSLPPDPADPSRLALKVRLLLALAAGLLLASTLYLLHARGVFEPTQALVLTTDDSEGVVVGMDMTFSGFPIGRVRRVELGQAGEVRIVVDVARKDARWLRTTSVFTLERSLVGGTALRAHTGVLADPPLPDGAVRAVLRGDATADIPRVMAAARDLLENLTAATAADAPLRAALANLEAVTQRARGPQGAMGALLGNEADARALGEALRQARALLARADRLTAQADAQVFGEQGLVPEARAALAQVTGLLSETRSSLRRIDAVLADAQAVSGQVREATSDLGALRAEVDANLRKIESMIDQINRRWPFAREPQPGPAVKLP